MCSFLKFQKGIEMKSSGKNDIYKFLIFVMTISITSTAFGGGAERGKISNDGHLCPAPELQSEEAHRDERSQRNPGRRGNPAIHGGREEPPGKGQPAHPESHGE